jgi:plasmid stabilization system protein ParE
MKITFDPKAIGDLEGIFAWISRDSERAAHDMIARIELRIGLLATSGFEHMGRPGLDPGTRELVEYPYIIVYEVFDHRDEIVVWTIAHGARDRSETEKS